MTTVLSADGCVETEGLPDTGCCPPPLCGNDLCCTFVAFMNLLPSGPLWDTWKARAIDYFQRSDDPSLCPLIQDPNCPSLVLHAIYAVLKLKHYTYEALWPALRESDPTTACITLDDWLHRLAWEDCYQQHCRTVLLGELTPYEVWGECGPIFCPPNFPPELEAALKKAIVISLTRAQMGVIRNLCGLNWIIEPLGAQISPVFSDPVIDDSPCASECDEPTAFEVAPSRDWLDGVGPCDVCEMREEPPRVQAYWDRGCDRPAGLPDRIWPGVLSAECIVRSMLPPTCPSNIRHAC
jgi:hypothetical protein